MTAAVPDATSSVGEAPAVVKPVPSLSSSSSVSSNTRANSPQSAPKPKRLSAKTDKPKPHGCTICGRSFARLEHLKRHERSHTKEKPFECLQCSRCFARRDLLLRHQQKLHQLVSPNSRPPRTGRRQSASGSAATRARNNPIVGDACGPVEDGVPGMRPRANTISHIDTNALQGLMVAQTPTPIGGHTMPFDTLCRAHIQHRLPEFPSWHDFDLHGMTGAISHTGYYGPPKLNTSLPFEPNGGMRTAPLPSFDHMLRYDSLYSHGSTVDPSHLHIDGPMATPISPYAAYHQQPVSSGFDDTALNWTTGPDTSLTLNAGANDYTFDDSPPSAISSAGQSGFTEIMFDPSNQQPSQVTPTMWQHPINPTPTLDNPSIPMEPMGVVFPELLDPLMTVSPTHLQDQIPGSDAYFTLPPPLLPSERLSSGSPGDNVPGRPNPYPHPMAFNPDDTSTYSPSVNRSTLRSKSMPSWAYTIPDAS